MPSGRAATWSGRLVLGVLLAAAMTWPMAGKFDRAARLNFGDGEWSVWNVTWVAHALTTNPTSLFQANIFHPDRDTLAYSEANVVTGALGVPFHLATGGNPYATHNGAILTGLVLAFVFAWGFAETLGASAGAAAAFAVAFTYCPFLFARTAHIQLMMTFGLPLSLQAFHRVLDRPTVGRGIWLGVTLAIQALACAYYGIFAGLTVGLGTLYYAYTRGLWRDRAYGLAIALGAVTSIGLVGPFFLPYIRVQKELGFTRLLEDAAMFSADWQAWLASSAWAHRWMLPWLERWNEVLFPGFLLTLMGLAGVWLGLRSTNVERRTPNAEGSPRADVEAGLGEPALPADQARPTPDSPVPTPEETPLSPLRRRETTVFYGLVGAIAFWASFGPKAGLYTALYYTMPVFTFLRAPGRFGILVVLALGVLALVALQVVLERRSPRAQLVGGSLVALLLTAEFATAPIRLEDAADKAPVPAAHLRLATMPPGAVVEMPFWYNRSDFPRHARYMLFSTYHWHPLVNGYSDHIPRWFRDDVIRISSLPTAESLQIVVNRHQAKYAIFHTRHYDSRSRQRLLERLEQYKDYVRPLLTEGDVWLYEIVGAPR
jgi:4-amino-4-deoxy-L-arabinose transferase-like glycosyltransferase